MLAHPRLVTTLSDYFVWLEEKLTAGSPDERWRLVTVLSPVDLYQLGAEPSDIPGMLGPAAGAWCSGRELPALEAIRGTLKLVRNGSRVQGSGIRGIVNTFATVARTCSSEVPRSRMAKENERRVLLAFHFAVCIDNKGKATADEETAVRVALRTLSEMTLLSVPTVRKVLVLLVAQEKVSRSTYSKSVWLVQTDAIYAEAHRLYWEMAKPGGVTSSVKAQERLEQLRRKYGPQRAFYQKSLAEARAKR